MRTTDPSSAADDHTSTRQRDRQILLDSANASPYSVFFDAILTLLDTAPGAAAQFHF